MSGYASEASIINDEVLRIVMVGKTGAGKSATGNTILGSEAFKATDACVSETKLCKEASRVVNGRQVSVVDTPGLFDTGCSLDKTIKELTKCIELAAPGPHAFLVVIRTDCRFTKEERTSVGLIQDVFGPQANEYTMVLFTRGDQLESTVEEKVRDCPELQELISKCKGGYHVFNNRAKDSSQVNELLDKINQMVENNGGSHYTSKMFQDAAKEMKKRIEKSAKEDLDKEEEQRSKEREEEEGEVVTLIKGIVAVVTASIAAGSTIGGALTAVTAAAVAGPIGLAVGAVIGIGAIGYTIYKWNKNKK